MAYLTFSELGGAAAAKAAAAPIVPQADPVPVQAGLSPLEWSVVAIARNERLGSLRQPGRVMAALGSLFGARPRLPLADPKLEALRRLSVRLAPWRQPAQVRDRPLLLRRVQHASVRDAADQHRPRPTGKHPHPRGLRRARRSLPPNQSPWGGSSYGGPPIFMRPGHCILAQIEDERCRRTCDNR